MHSSITSCPQYNLSYNAIIICICMHFVGIVVLNELKVTTLVQLVLSTDMSSFNVVRKENNY